MAIQSALTVLLTGVGAPGTRGTLYALRRNPECRPVRVIGVDINPEAVGRYLVDKFYVAPQPEASDYVEQLGAICEREAVCVILPQTTREISKLSASIKRFEDCNVRLMVSSREAIELANDKGALLNLFGKLGLPCPRWRRARGEAELTAAAAELGYPDVPVVVKPPASNGQRGVRILCEEGWDVYRFLNEKPTGLEIRLEELLRILRRGPEWPELLVMDHLPGAEYTVDAFLWEGAAIALPRLRKTVRSGITFSCESEFRHDLCDYSLRVGRNLGLRYVFGFQFKLDANGTPKVLECNPRIQGTMVASVFCGVNLIWLGVKAVLGQSLAGMNDRPRPARFYRFWGGLGISDGFTDEI